MTPMRKLFLATLAVSCFVAAGALAEDPVALIGEGAYADGLPVGAVVGSINNSDANGAGGWGFSGTYSVGGNTLSMVWGNYAGGMGSLIREEGYFAPYTQTSFESFWGMGLNAVSYSPSSNLDGGSTGLDGVWLDDTPVAVEEMVYPHMPGYWFSFGSRPACTEDGIPYFVGGITDTQGGSTQMRGLFYGFDVQKVMMTGDLLPNMPAALYGTSAISFDYRMSAYGTHHIAEVVIATGSTSTDGAMVMDAEGLMIGGTLVQEGTPVPASAGAIDGENWDNFDFCSVTETGSYMFTGDTDGDTGKDEFLLIDGVIVLREGESIGDFELSGSIEGAYMNEAGDWAAIWDVNRPTGENVECLIYNGNIVLMEGDIIDTDGDGVPDPSSVVDNFTGTSSLVVAEPAEDGSVTLYFTADVDIADRGGINGSTVLAADEALGLDDDVVIEESSRAVVEVGYGLTIGGSVPTMLGGMDIMALDTGVQLNWRLHDADENTQVVLRARAGDRTWEVPCTAGDAGRFSAIDRGAFGGEVTYTLYLIGANGDEQMLGEQVFEMDTPASKLVLDGAYPNPFNPETKILFRVGDPQRLEVAIYDVAGNLVNKLASEVYGVGVHEVTWNGCDRSGASVPSGTYFARVMGADEVQTSKLLLVK